MKEEIAIEKQKKEEVFVVMVKSEDGETRHEVHVAPEYKKKLVGEKVATEKLLEASFRFLLEREQACEILSAFELSVIETYFPEYPRETQNYL